MKMDKRIKRKYKYSDIKRKEAVNRMSGDNNPSKRFEVRLKISKSRLGKIPWNKGIPWSNEVREKIRKAKTNHTCLKETKELMKKSHKENPIIFTKEIREKITKGLINAYKNGKVGMHGKHHSKEYYKILSERLRRERKKQVLPKKDTSIEIKIQNFLKQLGIDFFTHQYIKEIEHGYQCDIFIPVQEGISRKTIIECFGTYWHNYPLSKEVDIKRCTELREKSFRVLVFWENEIKVMELNDLKEVL
jgi:very-short-patch-repair endonuclease